MKKKSLDTIPKVIAIIGFWLSCQPSPLILYCKGKLKGFYSGPLSIEASVGIILILPRVLQYVAASNLKLARLK